MPTSAGWPVRQRSMSVRSRSRWAAARIALSDMGGAGLSSVRPCVRPAVPSRPVRMGVTVLGVGGVRLGGMVFCWGRCQDVGVADRWWVIHEDVLFGALVEAHDGAHPDVVFVELVAGCESESVPPAPRVGE